MCTDCSVQASSLTVPPGTWASVWFQFAIAAMIFLEPGQCSTSPSKLLTYKCTTIARTTKRDVAYCSCILGIAQAASSRNNATCQNHNDRFDAALDASCLNPQHHP